MSTLKADTIQSTSGGAATLTKQSAAKAWLNGSNSAALNDSFNVSSGTDNGTGNYTYAFSNSMDNANWSPAGIVPQNSSFIEYVQTLAAGSALLRIANDSGAGVDSKNSLQIHGDLA